MLLWGLCQVFKMSNSLTSLDNDARKGLPFGIPLRSICRVGEVHSSLKKAFKLSYETAINSERTITDLLTSDRFQRSLDYRLRLKDEFAFSKSNINRNVAPGAVLWVIRHFIGLLPSPLMPRRIGDQKYVWKVLSHKCRKHLARYYCSSNEDNDQILIEILASELLRLPPENFVLLATFFNFMRMLAVLPFGEPNFNKQSALALVKYYTSALLVKPFRPGCFSKAEGLYYPLIFYIIMEWNAIRHVCVKNGNYTFASSLESSNEKTESECIVLKNVLDDSAQTSQERERLVRAVPQSYHGFDFLRDVGCQTSETRQTCCSKGSHYEKEPNEDCEVIFKTSTDDKYVQASSADLLSPKSDSYMYDSYSNCDLICVSDYEDVKTFDPVQKVEENSDRPIGWFYSSSPRDLNETTEGKESSTPIGWNIPTKNAYQLCFGVQKLLNEELKLKFQQMKIDGRLDNESPRSDRISGSERNLLGATKIKSRLDFLRIFNSKKQKTRKSISCEHVHSRVKYERMGSVSSFL